MNFIEIFKDLTPAQKRALVMSKYQGASIALITAALVSLLHNAAGFVPLQDITINTFLAAFIIYMLAWSGLIKFIREMLL